jgi:lipopolysaccharide export system protein LptA
LRKNARFIIAVFGVVFALFVALQLRRGGRAAPAATVRSDPGALMETTGGNTQRFRSSHEDVSVSYDKLLTYANGSSKLIGVTITTADRRGSAGSDGSGGADEDRGGSGRTFVVTGREGVLGQSESSITLDGDVRLRSSDGMAARTEHATYAQSDGAVAAPGPVEFAKGRLSGRGTGLKYDKGRDTLWILEQAVVHVAPATPGANASGSEVKEKTESDSPGKSGGVDIAAGSAAFARRDHLLQFDRHVRILREGQTIEADTAIARLSDDEQRIETLELHKHAHMAGTAGGPGSLRALSGSDMTLTYSADGQAIQRALIFGQSLLQLAGEGESAGRQIAAQTLDISMAPDGMTPTGLTGREAVQLTFPAEAEAPARTIQAAQIESRGEADRGLTSARFTGGVVFRERGPEVNRAARSAELEIAMKPGMTSIDEARFLHAARFEDGKLAAFAAVAKYDMTQGTLELTGSEPGSLTPRAVNDRIAVDATRIDIVLEGPQVKAAGAVKSTLQPATASAGDGADGPKLPSMLKQDQPVTVLADNLIYDSAASTATYTGGARLFQVDTTVKADTLVIDEQRGDLAASGHALTTMLREAGGKGESKEVRRDGSKEVPKERTQTTGTSNDLKYEDGSRKLTYTGAAHLVGPNGDMTGAKIEVYLKPSGDDVERVEGYAAADDKLTLREPTRTTTGAHLTYTAANERYLVTGLPASVVEHCGRETTGKTLTLFKSTDTIVIDGNQQIRTQTRGGSAPCK